MDLKTTKESSFIILYSPFFFFPKIPVLRRKLSLGRKWFVEYKKRLHLEDIPKQSVAKTAKKEKEGRNSVGTSAAGYWQCDARLLRFVVPLSRQRLRRRRDTATCALRCSWHRARRTSFKAKARHGMGEKSQRPGAVGAARTWVPFATITS